jgi:transcriptional regulator with GAF, ATPase, and Fis domain
MEAPSAPFTRLLASLYAVGASMREAFDPHRFLGEFSRELQPLVPHDRLVLDVLEEDARAFTVFAEHVVRGPRLHEAHYTTSLGRERYVVAEWAIRPVFAGGTMLAGDVTTDPRFVDGNRHERRLGAEGMRSALAVPVLSGGRVVGALVATSAVPDAYTDGHLETARRVAELIGPLVDSAVLLERERRRRRRLGAVQALTPVLGASLDAREVFARLAEGVRPLLDFDVMGASLISASGRDVEILAEVGDEVPARPARLPLADFSFAKRVEAGEVVVIRDTLAELAPDRPGDRFIIDSGGRSSLCVPLRFHDAVGGALYFGKRAPEWFDASDIEVAEAIAAQVTLAIQHQRLAEEQRRLAAVEGRARRLEQRVASLESELGERYGFDRITGRSAPLREALSRAAKVAPTETTVLVTGESGTGKELVARAIHHASARAAGPFVALNCAALPETLLESELFGHERGAFTGADRQKPGRFEAAAGGTLFLDEVAELSAAVQAKLLRVLQEREFQRVGATTTLKADVRLIAATHRDLARLVEQGRFREDLFYRLNVFTVHLPALRERGDDVLLLAAQFARELAARMGKAETGLSRDAREALLAHPWPGNIRELQNAIERALIVSEGGLITSAQLGLGPRTPAADARPPETVTSLADWERRLVVDALARADGNRSKAARMLGLTRSQLYTRLKRFGLE